MPFRGSFAWVLALALNAAFAQPAADDRTPTIESDPLAGAAASDAGSGRGFDRSDLSGVDFRGEALVFARLRYVRIDRAAFDGADLSYATLIPVSARDASFARAILTYATANSGSFEGASFALAHMESANFVGASLVGASLRDANLSAATFAHADLTRADLRGAIVTGADFFGALFGNTVCPDGTNSDERPRCGF